MGWRFACGGASRWFDLAIMMAIVMIMVIAIINRIHHRLRNQWDVETVDELAVAAR